MTRQVSTENSSSSASSASATLSSDIKSASLIGRLTDFSFPDFEESAWLGRCLKVDVCAIGNAFKSSTGSIGDFHFTPGTPSNCFSIFVVFLEIAIAHCSPWVCFFSVLSSLVGGMGTFDHQFPLFASGVLLQPEKLVAYHFPRVGESNDHSQSLLHVSLLLLTLGVHDELVDLQDHYLSPDDLFAGQNQPRAVVGILVKAAAHHHAPPYRPLQLSWSLRHFHHLPVYGSPSGVSTESPVHHLA
ncbi:hypothetical protein M5K25_005427 [Dendrobium thyrsiflorum]|uniref:Uncharacterized protein n=1 Tax=Dendrobium thyrsiflorum TaxID=117978 RepID=A0ABD0VHV9_DENTH